MMIRHGNGQESGELPVAGEDAGGFGVADAKRFHFGGGQLSVAGDRLLNFSVFVGEGFVESEHADVGEQRGKEAFIFLQELESFGEDSGGGGGVDAVTPVFEMIEAFGLLAAEILHK